MPDTAEKIPKVARDQAELEVDLMLEALGVDAPEAASRETLILAAMDGRITFDAVSEQGVYKLARPVALANGQKLSEVNFHEPDGEELQYVYAGQRVEVNAKTETAYVDVGQNAKMTTRFLTKISNIPLGVAQRMKARDLGVMEAIAGFFQ
jgi:predicted DNA-binding antitoxin AbrB/MazE fold protein